MRNYLVLTSVFLLLVGAACSSEVSPTPTVEPSSTPLPTATPIPTATPEPTATPTPYPASSQSDREMATVLTLVELAAAFFGDDNFESAVIVYSEVLEYEMDSELRAMVYALRAEASETMGDFDAAIADYANYIRVGGQDPMIVNNLCWAYGITGQPEQALPYCEQAVEANPSSPECRDSRGVVYAQLGRYEEALADFEAAVADLEGTTDPMLSAIRAERQEWIDILQSGGDPITPAVLEELRQDTVVATPVPPETTAELVRLRRDFVASAGSAGFEFGEVTIVDGQETVTGTLTEGPCEIMIILTGSESDLSGAATWLTGCDSQTQMGYSFAFLGEVFVDRSDFTRAMVWMIADVYYVMDGQDESAATEIGNTELSARFISDPEPAFGVVAVMQDTGE